MLIKAPDYTIAVDIVFFNKYIIGTGSGEETIARVVQDAVSDGKMIGLFDKNTSGITGIGTRISPVVSKGIVRMSRPDFEVFNNNVGR